MTQFKKIQNGYSSRQFTILSLETAMLTQFGSDDDLLFRKTMTGATGGSVCVIVLGMAVFMIVKA